MSPRTLALVLAFLAVACDAPPAQDPDGPPFSAVADVQQLMLTVLEPAAEHYWDAVGWIIDESGTLELRPSSAEEWEAVRNAAFVIAESGNLLMIEGRALEDPDPAWMAMSRALVDVGRVAIAAADAEDDMAVFDAGAEVYYVCTNCHAVYALETLRPSDERAK